MSNEKEDVKKEIEVVNGDGTNLIISPVYDHINAAKPKKDKKPTNIIIPKDKRNSNK